MNIDINKKSIDLFKISRPRDINLNFGVGSKNEFKSFFYNKDIFQSNTFDNNFARDFLKEKNLKKRNIEIKTISYLSDLYLKGKKIDLLDIDAEGFDFEVLKGINFEKYEIDLIMIEVHNYDETTKKRADEILKFLNEKNYVLVCGEYPGNCIFKYQDANK